MQLTAILPLSFFALVSATVAFRLFLLGLKNRALPELALGSGILGIAFIGLPCCVLGRYPTLFNTTLGNAFFALGFAVICGCIELFFVFSWCVFRRDSALVKAFVSLTGFVVAFVYVGLIRAGDRDVATLAEQQVYTLPWGVATVALLTLAFGWSGLESIHHWRLQRRRALIGLSNPIVRNRFLLWGIGGLSTAILTLTILAFMLAKILILRDPLALGLISLIGNVASVSWYFSFLAPRWYLDRVRNAAKAPA